MYQIDVASAAPVAPTPAAAGTPGYFTEGDPVGGVEPTVVPADFLNAVMMEMLAVLVAVGVTPSKTNSHQMRDALPQFMGTHSVKFPSGLIINWGGGTHADNTGAQAVTFETPFTSAYYPMVTNNAGGPPVAFHGAGNFSDTGMTVYSSTGPGSVAAGAGTSFFYLCIGR